MKRIISLLICAMLLLTMFAGCARQAAENKPDGQAKTTVADSKPEDTKSAEVKEPTTLKFWTLEMDNMGGYLDGFVDRFNAANSDIKVEATIIPGTAADFETKLNAAKMSGLTPDCVYIVLSSLAPWGSRGEFLILDDYIAKWDQRADFLDSAIEMGKVGGKYMGLGVYPAPVEFVYRKDMFEAAGLDPAKPPKNWEELKEYAVKLTKKDAKGNIIQAGLDIPTIDFFLNISEPFMLMNGAQVIDEVNMKPMLTEPAVIETLEYLYSLVKEGVSLPHDWQKKETMPFMNGMGAMAFLQVQDIKNLLKNKPELDGKVLFGSPIQNKKAASFCGYRLFSIMKDTKYADQSWKLMDAFCSKEEMKIRVDDWGVIPVRKSLQDLYIQKDIEVNKIIIETVAAGKGAFSIPWVNILYKYYSVAYESIMQGKVTPAEAMKTAQEQILAEIQ